MMRVVVLPPLAWINSGTLHDEGGDTATVGLFMMRVVMLLPQALINSGTLHDVGGGATNTGINQQWDGLLVMMVVVLPPQA
jgi:hypothetical protein